MKKTGKTLVMILASAMAILLAGCKVNVNTHTHTFTEEWTSDATQHWHAATCEHTTEVKDKAEHSFGEWTDNNDATWKDGTKTRECRYCGYKETVTVAGSRTDMFCENYYDAETNKIATSTSKYIYFGVFPKTVLPEGSTVTVDETDSVKMGANTYYKGSDGNYYAKVKENAYDTGTEYKYSDDTQAKQSDANSYRYFKVEPIKWKVITTNYNNKGKALLLAEDILTANVPYNVSTKSRTIGGSTVYENNYKYSTIRAYLNGKYERYDTQDKTAYNGKGFLQTAFTTTAQSKIAETVVDNSAASITDAGNNLTKATTYACANTTDKIFLLSEKEVTTTVYGFAAYNTYGVGNARIRFPTDYAKANYADSSGTGGYGGLWWLRSPCYYTSLWAYYVSYGGSTTINSVSITDYGLVPALSISL